MKKKIIAMLIAVMCFTGTAAMAADTSPVTPLAPRPSNVQLTPFKSSSSLWYKVSWKGNKNAQVYQIQFSKAKSFEGEYVWTGSTEKTNAKIKMDTLSPSEGDTFYCRVRSKYPMRSKDGKAKWYCSRWRTTKAVWYTPE